MNFLYLFILTLLGAIPYWNMPKSWRRFFLLGLSFLCVAAIHIGWALYFVFNIALTHRAASELRQSEPRLKPARILTLALLWLIGNLCFFKYTPFLLSLTGQFRLPILFPLGLSYIIFRLVHYVIEVYRRHAPVASVTDLGLYVLFFPTFLAGPVERFPKFHGQTSANRDLEWEQISPAMIRICVGLFKKFLVADRLMPYVRSVLEAPPAHSPFLIIVCVCLMSWLIYFDFSGYTDLALGLSRLYGYTIMENFNKPFFQKNIAFFWRSWHISVYSWIRDYFFFPLFGFRASMPKIYLGVFLTMMVFMLWHDPTINWLILGVYHGLGLVVYMSYQEIRKKHSLLREFHFRGAQVLSGSFTFIFVSIGFLFFFFSPMQVAEILQRACGI